MKVAYDREFNIAYLQLKEKSEQVRTVRAVFNTHRYPARWRKRLSER